MNKSNARRGWGGLLICAASVLCGGCVSVTRAAYPDTWSTVPAASSAPAAPAAPSVAATATVAAAQCPKLAGRYVNFGEVAPSKIKHAACGERGRLHGQQCNESVLSWNIGDSGSGEWVELRQPDNDTLVIVSSDPTVAVEELHRNKGDFSCSGNALERHVHASEVSVGDNPNKQSVVEHAVNGVLTAATVMVYGSGGVHSLSRRFSVAADGSLVMAESDSDTGLMFLIPYHVREDNLVRWAPAPRTSADGGTTPAADATAGQPTDLPSDHVGIFEATNGKVLSKLKVTNLDGAEVNTDALLPGKPIAMPPGPHWVQVGEHTTHWRPLRDINTKYAFELEAVAGHRYHIAGKLPLCLAPGNIDTALASPSVYHARVSVIDEAPGAAARNIEVEALCVSAPTSVCPAPGADGGTSPEGLQCVAAAGWKQGYYGRDAGAAPAQ